MIFFHGFYIIFVVFISDRYMEKKLLLVPGYLVGCGCLALITYRTILAVNTSSKIIMVQVNRFGEQYVDLVLLGLLWAVCMVGLWSLTFLLKELDQRQQHRDVGLVVARHTVTPLFLDQDRVAASLVSLESSPMDAIGYVYFDESRHLSIASVSVTVLQVRSLECSNYIF